MWPSSTTHPDIPYVSGPWCPKADIYQIWTQMTLEMPFFQNVITIYVSATQILAFAKHKMSYTYMTRHQCQPGNVDSTSAQGNLQSLVHSPLMFCDTYMRQWTRVSLVQTIFCAKPLSEPILTQHWHLDPPEHISTKSEPKCVCFQYIWSCRL